MKKKKIIVGIAGIAIVATIVGIYAYYTEYGEKDNEIKVMDYKSPEVVNEKGYKISKCEATNVKQWLDKNKFITLKDNGVYSNQNNDVSVGYISIYDLDTKTYTDYKNTNVYKNMYFLMRETNSPSGKYILFADPEVIPVEGSKEHNKSINGRDIHHTKMDILDLSTGEIIENFDKNEDNYGSHYKWINDDYIFIQLESKWRIIDKTGNIIKEGQINCGDEVNNYANLTDMSEIKVLDNDLSGSFYYQRVIRKSNNDKINELYSMDINTEEEKLVGKYENCNYIQKKGDLISLEYCIDEESENTSQGTGFKIMDINGNEIQSYESKESIIGGVEISPDGQKCAIIDYGSSKSNNENKSDFSLKVMDLKSGDIKEITQFSNLIDSANNTGTLEGINNIAYDTMWDSTGTSLAFTCSYKSQKDGGFYKSTYIITFDK